MNWKVIIPVVLVSILLGVAIWWYTTQEDVYYTSELPMPPKTIDGSQYVTYNANDLMSSTPGKRRDELEVLTVTVK